MEQKTLSQLLSHPDLPPEIRHEILAEMERQEIEYMINRKYNTLREFIVEDLDWVSYIGPSYWFIVWYECYKHGI